jgi:oligopeptide transport system substrate-binding protein
VLPALGTHFYRFNVEKAPFNNKKMRKAFTYALNRENITEHVLQGGQEPAMGFLPPSIRVQQRPFFQDNIKRTARTYFKHALEEMGITEDELPRISLMYAVNDRNHKIAQAVQQQWQRTFGIIVHLEQLESKAFFAKRKSGEYLIANSSWIGDFSDPINFLEIFKSKDEASNHTGWESAEYAELLTLSDQATDAEERKRHLLKAEKVLMEELPIVPVFFYTYCYLKGERVKGVFLSDAGHLDFKWASVE